MIMVEIDFNSEEALYMQLRNQIIMGIANSMVQEGESLPSVRDLAEQVGINMHTVNKAYAMLRNEGYLILDRRKGAVVQVEMENKRDEMEKLNYNMHMIVAQAICKGISREEMHDVIDEMYDRFT